MPCRPSQAVRQSSQVESSRAGPGTQTRNQLLFGRTLVLRPHVAHLMPPPHASAASITWPSFSTLDACLMQLSCCSSITESLDCWALSVFGYHFDYPPFGASSGCLVSGFARLCMPRLLPKCRYLYACISVSLCMCVYLHIYVHTYAYIHTYGVFIAAAAGVFWVRPLR